MRMSIRGLDTEVLEYYMIESEKAIENLSMVIDWPITSIEFEDILGEKRAT